MHLPLVDDRTARARIRDEALRLFAERGPDAVTMRDIAAAAGVSPALLVRHYGSKDGLVEAVDSHVVQALEALLAQVTGQSGTDGLPPTGTPTMLEAEWAARFEARLDEQRHLDTSRSLVGPETATWRIFGESVVLLGGGVSEEIPGTSKVELSHQVLDAVVDRLL